MPRLLPLLLVALGLLPAAAAQAAPPAAVAHVAHLDGGPALGGGNVLWAQGDAQQRALDVRSAPIAGGRATTVWSQRRPLRGDDLLGTVAASPTRVAVEATETIDVDPDGATAYDVVRTAAPGGPFALTAGDLEGTTLVRTFDLSGDLLATVETTNSGSDPKAYVRDVAAGGSARQYGPAEVGQVQVAGPYVAVSLPTPLHASASTIVVYDRASGGEVYRVAAPITQPYAFGFTFDLAPDGTLAILTADPASTGSDPVDDLAWASIAEPRIHVVASRVLPTVVRIADGGILFGRAHDATSSELALADLRGATRTVSFPVDGLRGADFDGTHLAMATNTCIYAGDLPAEGAAAPTEPPLGTCPQMGVSVSVGPRPTTRAVRVRVICTMGPASGCRGKARLITPHGHRRLSVAAARFAVPRGATRTLTMRISRAALATLRRSLPHHKTAYLDADAEATDAAGLRAADAVQFALRIRR